MLPPTTGKGSEMDDEETAEHAGKPKVVCGSAGLKFSTLKSGYI